jgi:tRNA(Ile)-lysidine synthase
LTVHGCVLRARGGRVTIRREPSRVAPPVPATDGRWDGRWLLETTVADAALRLGALGTAGLAALPVLAGLGLGPERLAQTAARMARARAALERATADHAAGCLTAGAAGDLTLDPGSLAEAADEVRLRLLAGALCWVCGARYRPRLVRLEAALAAIATGTVGHGLTVHGCVLRARGGRVTIRREPSRVAPPVPATEGRWDGRWALETPVADTALRLGALGTAGLAALPSWREAGIAREALLSTPAIWRGDTLVAAALVQPDARFAFRRFSALAPPWAPEIMR